MSNTNSAANCFHNIVITKNILEYCTASDASSFLHAYDMRSELTTKEESKYLNLARDLPLTLVPLSKTQLDDVISEQGYRDTTHLIDAKRYKDAFYFMGTDLMLLTQRISNPEQYYNKFGNRKLILLSIALTYIEASGNLSSARETLARLSLIVRPFSSETQTVSTVDNHKIHSFTYNNITFIQLTESVRNMPTFSLRIELSTMWGLAGILSHPSLQVFKVRGSESSYFTKHYKKGDSITIARDSGIPDMFSDVGTLILI